MTTSRRIGTGVPSTKRGSGVTTVADLILDFLRHVLYGVGLGAVMALLLALPEPWRSYLTNQDPPEGY
jgi:hypothetical protein